MAGPKKSLGQHWLHDKAMLGAIAKPAAIKPGDTVLEIGPGLGTLTSQLLRAGADVIAVEFDPDLARKLPGQFPGTKLQVIHEDILTFDLTDLPVGYKVVANVPYYITSKIVEKLMTANNKPSVACLLVQKEVAERIAAEPGNMSILGVAAQIYAHASLGELVPAEYFTPPPKVDSQVIVLDTRDQPIVGPASEKQFFRVVKAGFSAKRKMLRSSLSGGLGITKPEAETLLRSAGVNPESRAEDLTLEDWQQLLIAYQANS